MTKKESKRDLSGFSIGRKLTPEAIEEHRKRLGAKFDTRGWFRGPNQWVHFDSVSTFSLRIGELNPLYTDEEYAENSIYGDIVAPFPWITSVWRGMVLQGLPGVHAMMGGNDYEYMLPAMDGDKLSAETTFAEIEEKSGKFQRLWFIEHYDSTFQNQHGHLIAKQRSHVLRHDREEAEDGYEKSAGYSNHEYPHPWTEEEVTSFEDQQLDKPIQGAKPLFFEDVNEGDILPDLVRGPYKIGDAVGNMLSHDIGPGGPALIKFAVRKHKGYAYFHPMSRGHEHIDIIHWDKILADACGYPHPYDFGHNRQMWAEGALTDWHGDHGWLKKHSAEYRGLVMLGDVVWVKSKIVRKYKHEDGEYCVDIVQNTINQREQDVMPCTATVSLPSRENNYWPVSERLIKRGKQPNLPKA